MAEPAPASGATPDSGATPEAGQQQPTPPASQPAATDDDGDGLGEAGKRALADLRRELRTVTRDRDELARAKRERDDAERTELEKVTSERDDLRTRVATLEHEGRARTAASTAGIPDLWDRLKGDDEDELLEDAKAMAERLGQTQRQAPDLGAGPRQAAPATGSQAFNERIRRHASR